MWSARAFENGEHRFALTPVDEALKTGGLGSARATLIALASQWSWRTLEEIM